MDIDWAWPTGFICGAIVFAAQQGFLRWATASWWQGFAIGILLPGFSSGLAVMGGMAIYAAASDVLGFEGSFVLALVFAPIVTLWAVSWRSYGRGLYLNRRSVELGLRLTRAPDDERAGRAASLGAWAKGNEAKSELGRVGRMNVATALHIVAFDELAEEVLEPLKDEQAGELRARIAMTRGAWGEAHERLEALSDERFTEDAEDLLELVGVLAGDAEASEAAREELHPDASATQRLASAHAHARAGREELARTILDDATELLGEDFSRLAARYEGPASGLIGGA